MKNTYELEQLREENRVLYLNLVWLQYITGRIKDDTMIDEDSDKAYGFIDYKGIDIIPFPSAEVNRLENEVLSLEHQIQKLWKNVDKEVIEDFPTPLNDLFK